jgi:hypothetical protein
MTNTEVIAYYKITLSTIFSNSNKSYIVFNILSLTTNFFFVAHQPYKTTSALLLIYSARCRKLISISVFIFLWIFSFADVCVVFLSIPYSYTPNQL